MAWKFAGPKGAYTGRLLIDGEIYTTSEATKKFRGTHFALHIHERIGRVKCPEIFWLLASGRNDVLARLGRAAGNSPFNRPTCARNARALLASVAIVAVVIVASLPVVVVVAVAVDAAIHDVNVERFLHAEIQEGAGGNPHRTAFILSAVDGTHDGPDEAVIVL